MHVQIIDGKIVIDLKSAMDPAQAFVAAERLCRAAYEARGVYPADQDVADVREARRNERDKRKAPWLEELYCRIREVADDFHREATYRARHGGTFNKRDLDLDKSIEATARQLINEINDWDY